MSEAHAQPDPQSSPFQKRVRPVAARELGPEEAAAFDPRSGGANLAATDAEGDSVVDPTAYAERRRHSRHTIRRNVAQAMIFCAFLLGSVALFFALSPEGRSGAQLAAGVGFISAVGGFLVGRRTGSSSGRLRGYSVAAGVLCIVALALTVLPSSMFVDKGRPGPDKAPAKKFR